MNLQPLLLSCLSLVFIGCAPKSVKTEVPENHPANPNAHAVDFIPPPNVFAEDAADVAVTPRPDGTEDRAYHPQHQQQKEATTEPADKEHAGSAAGSDGHEHGDHHERQVTATVQDQVDQLTSAYLNLSDLLARDKADSAAEQLSVIRHAAHGLAARDNKELAAVAGGMAEAAQAKAEDFKALRNAFKTISPAMIRLVHLIPPSSTVAPTIHQVYCPMAKAPWLQTGDQVANPYYGLAMPRCGKMIETIALQGEKQK